ncbi:MAG: hypothetical protein F6J93_25255, partial [Oscillatoria sp. SIO1A7]|nr:hypothetical protein [Oscillatoria sp. SIO1A7]
PPRERLRRPGRARGTPTNCDCLTGFDISSRQGVRGETVGGTESEIYGMAVRETEEEIWVAIAANTPITGL